MSTIKQIQLPDGNTYDIKPDIAKRSGIFYGAVDSTSTATVYTAQIDGITEYYDGLAILLKNGVITSAANFTVNINGLGAKGVYSNMAATTRETTIFNINYTLLLIYDSTRVSGGCWVNYRGYYSDANSIGYQLRGNSGKLPMKSITYKYRLLFTSADGKGYVPANNSNSTNATASRAVCQTPIDPFGQIVYYSNTVAINTGATPKATYLWQQYAFELGYSFNRTGVALTLDDYAPVYVKCAPQSDGSAIMDATTPIVQALPSTEDGKIYIFLGITYSATNIELYPEHPVYYYKDGAIRLWTNAAAGLSSVAWDDVTNKPTFATVATSGSYNDLGNKPTIPTVPTNVSAFTNDAGYLTSYTETDPTVPSWAKAENKPTYTASEVGALPSTTFIPAASTTNPSMDGTASYGSGTSYARSDHVHPTDTSRQATLVSGTNIKTINGTSILGSGDLAVSGLPAVTSSDNGKVLTVVSGAWAVASLPTYEGEVIPSASGVNF